MAIIIILIIAFWFLPLPLILQVLMTVFGSLSCLARTCRAIVKASKNNKPVTRTGSSYASDLVDRFIK